MYSLEMSSFKRSDAGNTNNTFYQTNMQPPDWYKWFQSARETELGIELDDSEEWIEVNNSIIFILYM